MRRRAAIAHQWIVGRTPATIMVAVVVALAGVAHADPPAKPKGPQAYRSDLMWFDAANAIGIFVITPLAIREDRNPCPPAKQCADNELWTLALASYACYLAAGAVVHTEAGHHGRAVASAVLRIGLPVAAGLGADAAGADHDRALMIAGGGVAAAMMIDWWALADATYDPDPPASTVYVAPVSGGGVIAGYAARWR